MHARVEAFETNEQDHLFPCFSRADVSFARGQGAWLEADDGRRFLDFATGIAVTGLGHAHPRVTRALHEQADRVWHLSNAVRIPAQESLARKLCAATFADRVFFNNSGAEGVETAIKTARRYHFARGAPERHRILCFEGAFHGRTLATVSAGGRVQYLEGVGPRAPGFLSVPFGNLDVLEAVADQGAAAVLLEPIQGESGVRELPREALARIRRICNRHGLLLIYDEVQTGVGRTGRFYAYQETGVAPDILVTAKGLGNGFPVAAVLATEKAAAGMTPGLHGSTFGGNPLAMAVADAVVAEILAPGFLEGVRERAEHLRTGLEELVRRRPELFAEVRGEGFLLGLKCLRPVAEVTRAARAACLLTVGAGDDVLRLLPPLTIDRAEIEEGVARLERAADNLLQASL